MLDQQNIQIPMTLFNKVIGVFDYLNFSNFSLPELLSFDIIYHDLRDKQRRINLRSAYTNIVIANDDEHKRCAYFNYIKLKRK